MAFSAKTKPSFITYETVTVPDIADSSFDNRAIENFLIDFQGARVCLSSKSDTVSTLRLFEQIHAVTDELVIESKRGDIFLTPIYSLDDGIRDGDIITDFAFLTLGSVNSQQQSPYHLDLEAFGSFDEQFSPDDVQEFFASLLSRAHPSRSVMLSGSIPLVPLLLTVVLLRGSVESLSYVSDSQGTISIF